MKSNQTYHWPAHKRRWLGGKCKSKRATNPGRTQRKNNKCALKKSMKVTQNKTKLKKPHTKLFFPPYAMFSLALVALHNVFKLGVSFLWELPPPMVHMAESYDIWLTWLIPIAAGGISLENPNIFGNLTYNKYCVMPYDNNNLFL